MGFAHRQTGSAANVSPSATITVDMASSPLQGSVVCISVGSVATLSGITVADLNGNSYTLSPNSPASNGGTLVLYNFYLLSAPANASRFIQATWTGNVSFVDIMGDEFTLSSGTQAFDKDVAATGNSDASTGAITVPSITPTSSGCLLYSGCVPGNGIGAPATGGTLGSWTGGATDSNGPGTEYNLSSASGANTVDYTDNAVNDPFAVMIMSFSVGAGPVPAYEDDSYNVNLVQFIEPIISVF